MPPSPGKSMFARMTRAASLHLLILDEAWRPQHRFAPGQDWRATLDMLLRWDSRWLAIEQQRQDSPLPRWADIHLTRALSKRLRPMEIALADHVICGGQNCFSFREAGLL